MTGKRARRGPQPGSRIRGQVLEGLCRESIAGFLRGLRRVSGKRRDATRTSQVT